MFAKNFLKNQEPEKKMIAYQKATHFELQGDPPMYLIKFRRANFFTLLLIDSSLKC